MNAHLGASAAAPWRLFLRLVCHGKIGFFLNPRSLLRSLTPGSEDREENVYFKTFFYLRRSWIIYRLRPAPLMFEAGPDRRRLPGTRSPDGEPASAGVEFVCAGGWL